MIGLIKKDLLLIKGNLKTLLLMLIIFTVLIINGIEAYGFIIAFMSVSIMMSSFSYDEYNKFDCLAKTFPNASNTIVKSKYIATLIIVLISVILTFIISFITCFIKNELIVEDIISMCLGSFFGVSLVISIMYPLIYKFGIEKSRIHFFLGAFLIAGAAVVLSKLNLHIPNNIIDFLNTHGFLIFIVFSLIMLYTSYKISKNIYKKKEF